MKKYIVILILAILALSCERQLREPHSVEVTFTPELTVSFADNQPAVQLDSIAAYKLSGKRYVYKNDGEGMYVLPDSLEAPSHMAYAVYPVEGRDSLYRGVFCRDIKDEQVAVAGGYDQSALWYAGHIKDNNVLLETAVAFLQFTIVQPDAKSVTITSKSAPLTGMFTFAMNNVVKSSKSAESLNSVTLTGDFNVGDVYNAVCIPGSFKEFEVTMKNAEGYAIWNGNIVAESKISCSQTADLGNFGNPDVATVVVKMEAGEFDGYTVQSVNAFYGSDLASAFGGKVSGELASGQTTTVRFYGVGAGDYSNEKVWVVVGLEKDGTRISVPVQLDGLSIEASKTVTVELGALTASAQIESDDYYVLYRMGQNIQIGDLTVNQTDYPGAESIKASQITLARLQKGGLIFLDYEDLVPSVDVSTTDSYRELPNKLIVIGRNKFKQTELQVRSLRTGADVSFLNVKLTAVRPGLGSTADQMFSKLSGQKSATALRFKDCFVDNSVRLEFIRERATATSGMYSVISIENCIIKLNDSVNNATLYICRNMPETSAITLTNSVIYLGALQNFDSQVIRFYDDQFDASMVDLAFTDNTILNVHGNTGIIRRPKSIGTWTVSGNLVVADNTDNKQVITIANNQNVYFLKLAGTPSAGNNFLTTINYTGDANTIQKSKMQALTKVSTDLAEQTVNPFTSLNYTNGYFPVNTSVVTNGAGASYDSKYYITK